MNFFFLSYYCRNITSITEKKTRKILFYLERPCICREQLFGSLLRRRGCHWNPPKKENIAYSLVINGIEGVTKLTFHQLHATVSSTAVAKMPSKQEGSKWSEHMWQCWIFCKFFLLNSDDPFFEKDFILNRETMKTSRLAPKPAIVQAKWRTSVERSIRIFLAS